MGAPNATATPAAVPMAMKSLLSASLRVVRLRRLKPQGVGPEGAEPTAHEPAAVHERAFLPRDQAAADRKRDPTELRDDRAQS